MYMLKTTLSRGKNTFNVMVYNVIFMQILQARQKLKCVVDNLLVAKSTHVPYQFSQ